jgi:hypothetical protein
MRIALYRYKRDNPTLSQRALVKWLEEIHQVTMMQATINNTLQRLTKLPAWEETVNGNTKTRRPVMYQDVDDVATPLWPSVGVKPNTCKVGDLESSGTPKCSELDIKAQSTSH